MLIEGVAFDLEGTSVNVERAHHEGHLAAAAEVGVRLTVSEAIVKLPHFIGGPDKAVAEEIYELSGGRSSVEEIFARDKFHYERILFDIPIRCRPGFLETLKRLMAHSSYRVSIGSLTAKKYAEALLDKSGLLAMIGRERIVLAEDVKNLKPAPDVYLKTARRMGIASSKQLVFEDSPNGVLAARSAGSVAIGMPVYWRSETLVPLVNAGAVRIFADWREFRIQEVIHNLETETQ